MAWLERLGLRRKDAWPVTLANETAALPSLPDVALPPPAPDPVQELGKAFAAILDAPGLLANSRKAYPKPAQEFLTDVKVKWENPAGEKDAFSIEMRGKNAPRISRMLHGFLGSSELVSENKRSGPYRGEEQDYRVLSGKARDRQALDAYAAALVSHLNQHDEAGVMLRQAAENGHSMQQHLGLLVAPEYRFSPENDAIAVQFRVRTKDENLAKKLVKAAGASLTHISGAEEWRDSNVRKQKGGMEMVLSAEQVQILKPLFGPLENKHNGRSDGNGNIRR